MIFSFERAELDTATFELRVDGQRTPIEPQVFEVLAYLIEHRDRLIPRTELLDAVWGDRFVSDSALASRIAAARAAIGDDGRAQRVIRTVHGRGVQFVAPVQVVGRRDAAAISSRASISPGDAPPDPDALHHPAAPPDPDSLSDPDDLHHPDAPPDPDELHQQVRFTRAADGVELAVASIGDGPPLVKAANWLTHVEKDWRSPVWRHWMAELGSRYRYIRYDSRGCGLSDHDLRGSSLTDLATWTDDLERVVDSAGLDRFVLFAMSQGGGPALDYAVRHPERVSHLVLFGCYSRGMKQRGDDSASQAQVYLDLMRVGWGGTNPAFRSFFTTSFLPGATSEQMRWFNELQAETTTVENALLLEQAFYEHDFGDLAARVSVPTIVFHSRDDMASPYEEGRRLASRIPGAEFVTLDSSNHILLPDEPAWPEFLAQLERFTTES